MLRGARDSWRYDWGCNYSNVIARQEIVFITVNRVSLYAETLSLQVMCSNRLTWFRSYKKKSWIEDRRININKIDQPLTPSFEDSGWIK